MWTELFSAISQWGCPMKQTAEAFLWPESHVRVVPTYLVYNYEKKYFLMGQESIFHCSKSIFKPQVTHGKLWAVEHQRLKHLTFSHAISQQIHTLA